MPRVALAPLTEENQNDDEKEKESRRKLRTALAFLCGVERAGMPRDVFRVVLDLVMPAWDPLRRRGGGGQQL